MGDFDGEVCLVTKWGFDLEMGGEYWTITEKCQIQICVIERDKETQKNSYLLG